MRGRPAAPGQAADLYRLCGVHGDLVVSRVAVLDAQVKVFDVQVQVGQDELRAGPPLSYEPDLQAGTLQHSHCVRACERKLATAADPTLFLISVQITLVTPGAAVSC